MDVITIQNVKQLTGINQPVKNAQSDKIGEEVYVKIRAVTQGGDLVRDGLLMRDDEKITVTLHKAKSLTAPVPKGLEIGTVSYLADNEEWKRISLVTDEKIKDIDMGWCIRKVLDRWFVKSE